MQEPPLNDNVSDIKQKTVSGFIWRLSERICAQVVTFAVTVVLARILLPEDYGVVAIVNVFIAIADTLITGGLSTALIQKKDADETDFSTIFYTSLALSVLLYAVLFFTSPLISYLYKNELLTSVLRVMGIKFFISAVNSVQQAYVSRKMIFKKFFFATIVGTVISAVVGITLALHGAGVWALVAQALTNPFIDTIVLFVTVKWHPHFLFSLERLKGLFGYGWKVMGAQLSGTFFEKLKSLIVGAKYSPSDLAFYNRGESLPLLVTNNITATLESVLFPAISKFQDDKEKLKASVRRSMSLGSYVLMPLLFGLAAVSDRLVILLFTEKWALAIPFVQIVCMNELTALLNSLNSQLIKATGRSDVLLKLEFVKKPIYLLIIFLTIQISPLCMAIGAAVYGLIALFINSVPNKKFLNYSFFEQLYDVKNSFLLSLFMGVAVWLIGKIPLFDWLVVLIQVVSGIVIYVLLSLIFKNRDFAYLVNMAKERFGK